MNFGITEFEAGQIDPARFNHEEHIRTGWLYLVTYGQTDGTTRFSEALKRLTKLIGAPDKYHETVTCFFLDEIGGRLDGGDWQTFKAANADLFEGRAMIDSHYRPETIASARARSHYIQPDLGRRKARRKSA